MKKGSVNARSRKSHHSTMGRPPCQRTSTGVGGPSIRVDCCTDRVTCSVVRRERVRVSLHTDIPTRSELERLLTARAEPCVSISLAPTPIPQETQATRIALKNMTSDATGQLERAGARRDAVAEIGEALGDLGDDDEFWAEQARSLAIFASPGSLRTFRLPNRLLDTI